MHMEKREYIIKNLIMTAAMLVYLAAILSGSHLMGNITSPIVAFLAGYMILSARKNIKKYKLNWMLLAVLAFSWSFVDGLWMVASNVYGMDPNEMPVFMYLYLIPNILLTAASLAYFLQNIRKWDTAQVMLNLSVTLIMVFIFMWRGMLRDYDFLSISSADIIGTFLYLFTDIISISVIIVMFMQLRWRRLSSTLYLLAAGICTYGIADFIYTWLVFKDRYVPNTLIDYLYMLAIFMLCLSGLHEAYKPTDMERPDSPEILGKSVRLQQYVVIFLVPLVFFLTGNFTGGVIWQVFFILVIYQIFSSIVQWNVRNEYMLRKEKSLNEQLEAAVEERTRELLATNKALDKLVKRDTLTGLYNRRYFLEELDNIINHENSSFSILYMDLDRFKTINDTHGHDVGDKILVEISKRLLDWRDQHAAAVDMIAARVGGDEFSFIIKGDISTESLGVLCMELIELISGTIVIEPYVFNVGVSIGVSRYPIDATQREQLVKFADIAMYNAKREYGSKSFTLYSHDRSEVIQKRNEIEILLRKVDFDKEFELYYQPQFRISDNRLIGAEALLRWNSPVKGRIPPMDFIPLAEETGLILDIGKWVMEKAVSQICNWNSKFGLELQMGINISPRQIDSVDFLPGIKQLMERTGFDPGCIDFEITESSAMNTNVIMEEILTELSGMGINISIDDFGTGYSSLSYIKRFDIDRLKIAKELIDNISRDKNDLHIAKAIIMMAKGLGLYTIAEGVETKEQLDLLRMLGCDEVQGYYTGKPMQADDFEESLLVTIGVIAQNE